MRNNILKLTLLLLSVLSLHAEDAAIYKSVIVTPEGKASVAFNLDSRPEVTFTADEIVVTTASQKLAFPNSTKIVCTFSTELAGLETGSRPEIEVTLANNTLFINGLRGGEIVMICDVKGLTRFYGEAADGRITIDLSGFAAGIYILNSNQLSYKFLLK